MQNRLHQGQDPLVARDHAQIVLQLWAIDRQSLATTLIAVFFQRVLVLQKILLGIGLFLRSLILLLIEQGVDSYIRLLIVDSAEPQSGLEPSVKGQ